MPARHPYADEHWRRIAAHAEGLRAQLAALRKDAGNEHDAVILRNTRRRVNRARNFPDNTCAASRHLHLMANQLAGTKPYPMLQEEPQHCAMTMLAVLESLWKARTEVERLKRHNAKVTGLGREEQR